MDLKEDTPAPAVAHSSRQFWELIKTFTYFRVGLTELQENVNAINQSVTRALDTSPFKNVVMPLGVILSEMEMFVAMALIHQAARTPRVDHFKKVLAVGSYMGFNYRTRSGFGFGWRMKKHGPEMKYTFFVRLGPANKYDWVNPEVEKLLALGWEDLQTRKMSRSERRELTISPAAVIEGL